MDFSMSEKDFSLSLNDRRLYLAISRIRRPMILDLPDESGGFPTGYITSDLSGCDQGIAPLTLGDKTGVSIRIETVLTTPRLLSILLSARLEMQNLSPLEPGEGRFLEQDGDTSEHIVARLSCVNANRHSQV